MMGLMITGTIYLMMTGGLVNNVMKDQKKWTVSSWLLFGLLAVLIVISLTVVSCGIVMIFVLGPFIIFSTGIVFTINGAFMFHRESVSLGNSLALLLGVGLLGVSLGDVVAHCTGLASLQILTVAANTLALILLIGFLIFLIMAYVTQRKAKAEKADYIIVLGCGLVNHQVTPLLKSRLDRALELYQQQSAFGYKSKLVVTGGQGHDEKLSEAEAMKNYLVLEGVDETDVFLEDRAVNTYENMLFSKQLIEKESLAYQAIFVSNNFHVFRSQLFAKEVGLSAKGTGSQTAAYYLPSAMLREFAAVSLMIVKSGLKSIRRAPRGSVIYK